MDVLKYSEWRETCDTLHTMLQMMGKVKLETMPPQPEWGQVVLFAEPDGFTTGLVATGTGGFEIRLGLADARIRATTVERSAAAFSFSGTIAVAGVYARFLSMLAAVGYPCAIDPAPQEMATTVPFDKQSAPVRFDVQLAQQGFRQFLFARSALARFVAPFRGKKIPPSLFWGTFDMSAVLFSGRPCPFRKAGTLIERVAFDEQFVEFGFWPGDERIDDPSFYALAYPFLEDGTSDDVYPASARFDAGQAEYLLRLEDALDSSDPQETVERFCRSAFESIAKRQRWDNVDWLFAPLPLSR